MIVLKVITVQELILIAQISIFINVQTRIDF